MRKLVLVRLENEKPYIKNNLQKDMRGIVLNETVGQLYVLFFNPQNIGDYAIVPVNICDVALEKESLPNEIKQEILSKLDNIIAKAKDSLEPIAIREYDIVELLIEDDKYTKNGVHKGDRGCVVDANAVKNCIEVDFSGVNENGDFYGDCISVNINDLKVIK